MKMTALKIHLLPLGVVLSCLLHMFREAGATIVLFGNETGSPYTINYPSIDASFTPTIPDAGVLGEVYAADPLNGCSAFTFAIVDKIAFAIVQRGVCLFEDKVRHSQDAGFTAAIVYDDEKDDLVTMTGNGAGITAYALFVSKTAGENLLSLEGSVYILPGYNKRAWAITWLVLSVSLIIVVIVGAIVTALCCIRAHILAEAQRELERDELNERLLHDDEYILNREFIPDDDGLEAHDAMSENDQTRSEGPSESDPVPETSNNSVPN